MNLRVGDPVMHWTYGIGEVAAVEERVIAGRQALYYAISIRDLTIWVPADDHLSARLRPPTPRNEFQRLFDILTGHGEVLPEDRLERKNFLADRLKDGRVDSLCRVLRDLTNFQQVHSLNDNDQSLLKRSRDALLGEWSFVLSIPVHEAEAELRAMLAVGVPVAVSLPKKRPFGRPA